MGTSPSTHPSNERAGAAEDRLREAVGVGQAPSSGAREPDAVVLWRPTGPRELELVAASGYRAWPPRLPDQPIFYPVLNEQYATKIARDWNVPASGAGYVTRFRVARDFLDAYEVHQVGGRDILEYWIPAEDLDQFNAHIIGLIDVVAEYRSGSDKPAHGSDAP
jgi:hypothetical protein